MSIRSKRLRKKFNHFIRLPRRLMWAMVLETVETKDMLQTFAKKGRGMIQTSKAGPSEEEYQKAIAQLKDLPRILPFFVIIVVPAPGVTEGYTLLAVTLERWLGAKFRLLPDNFRDAIKPEEEEEDEITD